MGHLGRLPDSDVVLDQCTLAATLRRYAAACRACLARKHSIENWCHLWGHGTHARGDRCRGLRGKPKMTLRRPSRIIDMK